MAKPSSMSVLVLTASELFPCSHHIQTTCLLAVPRSQGTSLTAPSTTTKPSRHLCLGHQLALGIIHLAEGNEVNAQHEGAQALGHAHTLWCLVVLQDAAQRALRGRERRVEHVHEGLGVRVRALVLVGAHADVQAAGLEVCAVGARHQLAEGLGRGEPRLQVVLLGGCVVQLAAHDVDHVVGQAQGLVERLGVGQHLLHHVPAAVAVWRGDAELLHLLKLVDAEDA
mmetsp:Transcript_35954/g.90791  ORF Transcript_35954/g.90791 Transcript_35954/m.90791 type:complete len:226 (+) Transcript_35954:975-1652(+)